MACENCKSKNKSRKVIVPEQEVVQSYNEGDDGWTTIVYSGDTTLRIKGCESRHIFLFSPGSVRQVDVNDAECLVERKDFEYYVESENSESEFEQTKISIEDAEWDGSFYEISRE